LIYFLVVFLPADPAEPPEPAVGVGVVFLEAAFGAGFLIEFFFAFAILFIVKNVFKISKKS
jgi:hypothetical protein